MNTLAARLVQLTLFLGLLASPGFASPGFASMDGEPPEKAPSPKAKGKVFRWASTDGLAFEYIVPKDYDADVGANLTFILHGSNLSRRWGFANHEAGRFRPDDIVVSPDGTTSNGNGGFNFLQGKKDLERLRALQSELEETFRVRATFLYGHSQGSFFSFYYAGAYPDAVQGLVGHASGVWIGTDGGKKHHHQAIVLMHGTADPVVGYGQSVGGLAFYAEKKYPKLRLRSLEGWNHWPSQHHTAQQLAWCEAMTTDDPERLAAAFEELDDVKEALDPVAYRQVATRAAEFDGMSSKTKRAAEKAIEEVDEAAEKHAKAIAKSLGKKNKKRALADEAWVGHIVLYRRHFSGVPACDEVTSDWKKTFEAHEKAGRKHGEEFWRKHESDAADAFDAGLALVENAFLRRQTQDEDVLGKLDRWADDAKALKINRKKLKAYDEAVPVLRSAMEKGRTSYEKAARRFQ